MKRSPVVLGSAVVLLLLVGCIAWYAGVKHHQPTAQAAPASTNSNRAAQVSDGTDELTPTRIYAHNLMLRKGPDFRIYVRWLNGANAADKKERQSVLR